MFDLNQAIKDWRLIFKQSEQFLDAEIDELENHLMDEISALKSKELNDEEAFMVANHRLGTLHTLKAEYQKVHPNRLWQKRFLWMLMGFVFFILLKSTVDLTAKTVVLLTSFFTVNLTLLYYIEIFTAGICLIVICGGILKLLMSSTSIERMIPKRLNIIHYLLIAFFVSIGQVIPQFITRWMGSIHHASYWENWSAYGLYLGNIHMTNFFFSTFFPLIIFVLILVMKRAFNKTKMAY